MLTTKDKLIIYGVEEETADKIIKTNTDLTQLDFWLSNECCLNVIAELLKKGWIKCGL